MPFNLGGPELIIVLAIVLIVFGAGRLPSVMKDLGTGVREFRRAQHDADAAGRPTAEQGSLPAPAPVELAGEQGQVGQASPASRR
ncbi:MAG TPA: twin-arginine translocase TatA/TatE family subunit [Chloroflexota bacterium]|nr:twin-arginine translocase TatA/TatE family subunit [Chloroflexota bacterium]